MKRWYNEGRYERECAEWQVWRDNWDGIRRHRNERGEVVCIESPPCWLFFGTGFDANGSPVEAE